MSLIESKYGSVLGRLKIGSCVLNSIGPNNKGAMKALSILAGVK